MKTTITTILALMACAVAFSACTRELIEEPVNERPVLSGLRTMTFTAVQEKQDSTTKAAIDGRDIKWSKSDALSVFDGTGNRKFTLVGEGGSTSGTFIGSAAAASTYYAIYPYTEAATLNGSKIEGAVLPVTQTATAGSADPAAMLMMATSTDANTLSFKNVCAYVKVKPAFDCSRIVLKSKGYEKLAGTVKLDYNGGAPTAEGTADGTNSVTLDGTITSGSTYYIAALPQTLESGFAVRFRIDGVDYEKGSTKTLGLTRNRIMDLGSFQFSDLTIISPLLTVFSDAITGDTDPIKGYGIGW